MTWMSAKTRNVTTLAIILGAGLLFGACTSTQSTDSDYEKLAMENKELKDELSATTASLDAAERKSAGMMGDMEKLANTNAQLSASVREKNAEIMSLTKKYEAEKAKPKGETVVKTVVKRETGFDNIADAEVGYDADGNIAVKMSSDVLFDSGKATLKTTSRKALDQVAKVLVTNYGKHTVRVEGYTDSTPIKRSGWKDNLSLSAARAMAVQRYLASKGVKSEMYSAAFGPQKPVASNKTKKGQAQNRRVEIIVLR